MIICLRLLFLSKISEKYRVMVVFIDANRRVFGASPSGPPPPSCFSCSLLLFEVDDSLPFEGAPFAIEFFRMPFGGATFGASSFLSSSKESPSELERDDDPLP